MKKRIFNIIIFLVLISSVVIGIKYYEYKSIQNETLETLSQYGSSGDEVKQIQTKLKDWGYYSGNVDGIYGSQTVEAVKKFQNKNGLTADRYSWNSNIKCTWNIFKFIIYNNEFKLY